MKKILIAFVALVILAIIGVAVMALFKLCPPKGPWPTPPWCQADFTIYQYEVDVSPTPLTQIKAVNMYDTWGRNYNMNMFETTWLNIDSSFDRVQKLGAQEVYVHDFDRAVYNGEFDYKSLDYQLVDEVFSNDMRDESISEADLKKLAQAAHIRGLKLGIKRNLAFVDIGKFMLSGLSGNISTDVAKDYQDFNSSHSEEWIRDYFSKWQQRLVEKAKLYQSAGVDIMSISPSFQDPTFAGQEELANQLWRDLIVALRQEFKGEIMAEVNVYGFNDGNNGQEDWTKYNFYKTADIAEIRVYKILEKYQERFGNQSETMSKAMEAMLNDFNQKAKDSNLKLSVFFAPSSYRGGTFKGPVEYLDINNPAVKSLEKDYQEQVSAFDNFFKSLNGKDQIVRVNAGNFAWDDALDPEVPALVSISAGFRNKPAERVVEAWYRAK